MADAQSIILHHFEQSPFSEKMRLALRLKNLGWYGVEVPRIMPKPDLIPLTGGYRRSPVMQIGADIFCDTAIMLPELEKRFQIPALTLPGHEGIGRMIAAWTDGKWFQTSVSVIFGKHGNKLPQDFIEDRTKFFGKRFNVEAMAAAAPMLQDQWRSQLMWIEERLLGSQASGGGHWLIGTKPGLADVHAYMNPWFMEVNFPNFLAECFDTAPLCQSWYERLKAISGPDPTSLAGKEALEIAKRAAPRLKPASTARELRDFQPGQRVIVTADDYGKDAVEGDLVVANESRIIIAHQNEQVENLHIHFPRVGYLLQHA